MSENKITSFGEGLASFALKRPVTVTMVFFSMLLLGIISSRLLPLEQWPGIEIPQIFIEIPYQDATPVEVETMITRPVEEALATMAGIKRLNSTSSDNRAQVNVEFEWNENITAKSIEAREKIDAIRHLLPNDVERIFIYQFSTGDMPVFQIRVSSERDLSNAYDLLERNLKIPLERVEGVSKVELYGLQKKQISIRIDQNQVTALKIDTNQLAQTLREANFSMSAGHINNGWEEIDITPVGEYRSLQEIEDLYVVKGIRLAEIAEIKYEKPRREEGRHLDRTFAVGFNIFRESGSNLVEVSNRVLKVIDEANENPAFEGIKLLIMQDEADTVTTSLNDLLEAGMLGALLSFLVLYAFLRHFPSTMIVVLSVPFSICITLGFMYFFGYSINILSLMGLMLAIGMLVDNAVVVTESIYLEKEHYQDAKQATIMGVGKVSIAVIAGTLTTAIVFLPNIVGSKIMVTIFLEHVAVAICISLFASLLIAQTLIPVLATRIHPKKRKKKNSSGKIKERYQRALEWSLNNQGKTAVIAILMLISTGIPMQFVQFDEEQDEGSKQAWLNYNIQGNYSLEEVEKTVSKMEEFLYANQERFYIQSVYSYYTFGHASSGLTLQDNIPIGLKELKKMIKDEMPTFVRAKPTFRWAEGTGGGIRMTLLGQSSETLISIADQLVPVLSNIEGLTDVRPDIDSNQKELQILIDRQKAFRFGLNTQEISSIVAMALRGSNLRTFRHGLNGEVDIRMLYNESLQHSIEELRTLPIKRNEDQAITLDMIAEIKVVGRLGEIRRYYRQTALAIGANLEKDATVEDVRKKIEAVMKNIELPTGYELSLDGSFKNQMEAESAMMTNMLLALCMIYVVMAALFESLLLPTAVITSLIYSFTGVFWAFFLTGTSMSIMGMIGMLILMGIVVNNGIVLVDRINQLIQEGYSVHESIIQSCLTRTRPILMTVLTTILGLVPLALGGTQLGDDGPGYAPMAIAIIGGLTFSTLTSLFLVPLSYLLLLKLRRKTANMIQRGKQLASRVIVTN